MTRHLRQRVVRLRWELLLLAAAVGLSAQTPQKPRLLTVHFQSRMLAAPEPFDILLPVGYGASARRYPELYLLHGLGGHYGTWVKKTSVVEDDAAYPLIIVMPEGGTGYFINGAQPHTQWASYILDELIPYVDAHYRTIAQCQGRAVAGVSMGGYGALRFGIEDPDRFSFAAGLSPALAAHRESEAFRAARPRPYLSRICRAAGRPQLQMAQEAKQQRQRTTEIDERLNAPIDIVDKHIRHNGHTP